MKKRLSLLILPIVLVTGCASTAPDVCDPTNKNLGIVDKMNCNFSGHYQARVDQKQQILLDEQKANNEFKAIYASIAKQKDQSALTLKQRQNEQQKLKTALAKLSTEIKQKAQDREDLQAQLNDIDNQLNKVNNSGSAEIEKQVELDKLNTKLQRLQRALNL